MSNNNQQSNCGYESQIVSYLYDETTIAEKNEFERHIAVCSVCADEIAAFGNVRFSISEWREVEFSRMATPSVRIPKTQNSSASNDFAGKTATIFENFRNFFGTSNAFTWATAGFAFLLIFFGLGFFVFNSSNGEELAANTNQIEENRLILQNETDIDNSGKTINSDENFGKNESKVLTNQSVETVDNSEKSIKSEKQIINEKPVQKPNNSSKKSIESNKKNSPVFQNKSPSSAQTAKDLKKSQETQFQKKPSLTNFVEETEDESLRLADLFDEVETK